MLDVEIGERRMRVEPAVDIGDERLQCLDALAANGDARVDGCVFQVNGLDVATRQLGRALPTRRLRLVDGGDLRAQPPRLLSSSANVGRRDQSLCRLFDLVDRLLQRAERSDVLHGQVGNRDRCNF